LVSPIFALGVLIFALGIWGKRVGHLVKSPTQKSKRVGLFGCVNSALDLRGALVVLRLLVFIGCRSFFKPCIYRIYEKLLSFASQ
jgi:hypothetical protein